MFENIPSLETHWVSNSGKKLKKQDKESLEPEATLGNDAAREGYGGSKEDKMPNESVKELGGWDSVICRICEEEVTLSHLEPHSYICAYADKCEINCLDVDERLLKLEEILEQIIDSRSSNSFPQALVAAAWKTRPCRNLGLHLKVVLLR